MLTEQEKEWVAESTARLRLVQADQAETPAQKRQEFLTEEVSRKLRELPSPRRKPCLEALLSQFPVAGQVARDLPPAQPPSSPSPQKVEAPVATFEEVFQCFLRLAADLKPAEKNQVVAKLIQAGLSSASQGGLSPEVTEKLRKELGLAAGQQPLPERVAEMAAILVEVVSKVDQAATGALKQLSPRNPLLKAEALRRVLAQYVQTEQPAAPPSTRAFEMLSGALLTALLEGGLEFGRRYLERMQPSAIWDVATPDIFIDFRKKAAAWDHFRELSTDFYSSPEKINQSVKQALGATIDAAVSR